MSETSPREGNTDSGNTMQSLTAQLQDLRPLRLTPSHVKTGRMIGDRSFKDVFRATLTTRDKWYHWLAPHKAPVAVARFRIEGTDDQRIRIALLRDLLRWSSFDHPNVTPLLGFYVDEVRFNYLCAVTEWQPNGNILQYVERFHPSEDHLLGLLDDLASAVAYLHSLTPFVVHGAIKPENALVNKSSRAILSDFRLSLELEDVHSGFTTTISFATQRYASPEVMENCIAPRGLPSDVWSFGCLVFRLLSGREPYDDVHGPGPIYTAAAIDRRVPGDLGLIVSSSISALLRSCWAFSPAARPTMETCMQTLLGELSEDPRSASSD